MVRKFAISIVSILFAILMTSYVIAYTTEITISTLANHDVEVKVSDPLKEENNLLESFSGNTENTGRVSFSHNSDKSRISVNVIIRKEGKIIPINDEPIYKLEDQIAGRPINIELIPGAEQEKEEENLTEIQNTTESNETTANLTEAEAEETSQSGVTGEVISENDTENKFDIKEFFSSNEFYIIGIAVLALIAVFVVFKMGLIKKGNQKFKTRKYSEIKKDLDEENDEYYEKDEEDEDIGIEKISVAEEKLREAQEEINKLKKIQDAKKRLAECKRELDRLRRN